MSDPSVPRETPDVPKTAALGEAARYYSDGYVKVDKILHASASDVGDWIEQIQEIASEQFPEAAADINNVTVDVNVVPMSSTGEVYGLAYIFIHSLTKNHSLYNLIVGLNFDGSPPEMKEELNPETGQMETHVVRSFQLPPLRMNDTSMGTYFSTVKKKYEGDPDNEVYLEFKGNYDDYLLYRELTNVKHTLKKKDLSPMDKDAAEKKQDRLVAQFREAYELPEGKPMTIHKILKTLKPSAESISTFNPEAKKAFVVDPKPGESRIHLVSRTALTEQLFKRQGFDIRQPGEILSAVKSRFSRYCTTSGPQVRTYPGLGKKGDDLKVDGERPHVFFSSDGYEGGLRLHVVYNEGSNDGLYALKMSTKFSLAEKMTVQNTILMVAKRDHEVPLVRAPRENDNFHYRPQTRRNPRSDKVAPRPLPSANKENFPGLAKDVDQPAQVESVWTQPLSEFIRKGDDVTIPQSGPSVSVNATNDFVRVYGPSVRSDGNEDRFF
jgi:hypothetical protein